MMNSKNKVILMTNAILVALVFIVSFIIFHPLSLSANEGKQRSLVKSIITSSNPGGDGTVSMQSVNSFSLNSANMSSRRKGDFLIGNDFFEDPWVIAPSSTTIRDGLGPLFNVSSCQSCHINDGSGHAPNDITDNIDTLLIRLSQKMLMDEYPSFNKANRQKAHIEDAQYGGQIQNRAVPGVQAEMQIAVDYTEKTVTFNDGFEVALRQPIYHFSQLNYGNLHSEMVFSPRVANQMIGLGLLEAIDEKEILALAKEQQADYEAKKSKIKGVANWVWDIEKNQMSLGRFGWKAGQPTVEQQVAAAFNGDLGLTSRLFPQDHCLAHQIECLNAPNGNDKPINITSKSHQQVEYEIRDDLLDFVSHYSRNLAVPARRNVADEKVKKGAQIFVEANCSGCHKPSWQTKVLNDALIEQSNQTIWPYTDMLLHDMGEALSDFDYQNKAVDSHVKNEFRATVRHWRTAPLWGLGLRKTVNKDATFLHDGRARTILEAVLWHGGEAENSKQHVLSLSQDDREALVAFLESI